jgi:hypothetical protein
MAGPARKGFPQDNIQSAGVKSGTGAAYGSDQMLPIDPLFDSDQPDRFPVADPDNKVPQDDEMVNGHYENTKSGPLAFADGKDLRPGH